MDLKRNQITVGELLDHPGARAVFQRRFPMLMKHPMLGAARTITLEQILSVAQAYVPQKKIDETLSELIALQVHWLHLPAILCRAGGRFDLPPPGTGAIMIDITVERERNQQT